MYRFSRHSLTLAILTFYDLTFISTMKINYHFQNTNPCSPQRYLANLEAMFEAYPQFLIHLYFLVSLDETAKSSVIMML